MINNKKNLKNKDATHLQLIPGENNEIDIYPVEKGEMTEDQINKRDFIMQQIMSTNAADTKESSKPELNSKGYIESVQFITDKLKALGEDKLKEYLSQPEFNLNSFLNLISLDCNSLSDAQTDFVFNLFTLEGAKIKEYNEFGLPKDIDPEVLEYVTNAPFNPDVDQYVPPVFENLHCNRVHVDINRNDLDEDYREVYDILMNDEDILAEDEMPDDFVLLANQGALPVKPKQNFDSMMTLIRSNEDNKNNSNALEVDEEEIEEDVNTNLNKKKIAKETKPKKDELPREKKFEPSYKYISAEEKKWLDSKYKEVLDKEYKEAVIAKPSETKSKMNPKVKAQLDEALDEIICMGVKNKFPNKIKNEGNFDKDENDEDEAEEEEDEYEEYEDLDENELNDLKIQDGVDLLKKEDLQKMIELNQKLNDQTDKKEKEYKKPVEKPFMTWEELDEITHKKENIDRTLLLIENYVEPDEESEHSEEVEKIEMERNIITALTEVSIVKSNFPKKIGVKSEYIRDKTTLNATMNKGNDLNATESRNKELTKGSTALIISKPVRPTKVDDKPEEDASENKNKLNDSKDENKERKKQIKQENKERRQNKKALKEAFNKEKVKAKQIISSTNKILRTGLSVKEI